MLMLAVGDRALGLNYSSLPWPFNGLMHIASAVASLLSPLALIYLVVLTLRASRAEQGSNS